jgi:hypothetical protein
MLLGQRLVVRAPDEIDVAVQATLEAAPMRDTTAIEATALAELARRLAPIATAPGEHPRELGVKLTAADIGAWLRKLDGVAAVRTLTLRDAAGRAVDEVQVGPFGLPRLDPASLTINVVRGKGRSRT